MAGISEGLEDRIDVNIADDRDKQLAHATSERLPDRARRPPRGAPSSAPIMHDPAVGGVCRDQSPHRIGAPRRHSLRNPATVAGRGGGAMDGRRLVERAGRGDHDAFTQLATAAAPRLDAAARLILRDPELARDAVQNTLVRAWRDLPGLRDPDRFDAWLHRLLVNASLDEARRRRRRPVEVEMLNIDEPAGGDARRHLADPDLVQRALAPLQPAHPALLHPPSPLRYPLP